MPEWLISILVGGVIMSLIAVIYGAIVGRISRLEKAKDDLPKAEDLLTKTQHSKICKESLREIKDLIVENKVIVLGSMKDFKENVLLTMENNLLKEIKKRNGD